MVQGHRFLTGGLAALVLGVALILILSGGQGALAQGDIVYVDADATGGANTGSSWADAYTGLQDALGAAASGDEIWVAAGIYTPVVEYGGSGDRFRSFQLINGVAIYGGFDPSAGDIAWEDRDWAGNVAVLSGDLNGDDGPGFENNGENSYHVFYHPEGTGLDGTAILDGVTISGGNANGDPWPDWYGGGMFNHTSSPTVSNCTFLGNSAGYGGGMYNHESSPELIGSIFAGNSAFHDGGGMYNWNVSSLPLTDCTFSGNAASEAGGGLYNMGSSPVLTDCDFSGNSAGNGGGIYNHVCSPELVNCTFTGNSASLGGGMQNKESSPTVTNCSFRDNSASSGGGIFNDNYAHPVLTICAFEGNSAVTYGGGIFNFIGSAPALTGCTFVGNAANYGGGMANSHNSSPTLANTSFYRNEALNGGGMYNHDESSPVLTNCTFFGNVADLYGGGIANLESASPALTNCILWGDVPAEMHNNVSSSLVEYSDIEGGCDSIINNVCGTGNIDADPLFVDPDHGDLHLSPDSPCIDAGSNDAPSLPDSDFEGHPRVMDGNGDGIAIVDMGVDEAFGFRLYLPLVLKGYP